MPRAFGSFALLKHMARGERGDVFAALRPVEVERFCVLKILADAIAKRPEFVPSLRSEATRLVRRIHGNLVQIYDVGLVDQRLFFVTELVEGTDLGTLLGLLRERRQSLPADVAVYIAMEVAAALAYLRRLSARSGEPTPLPAGLSPRAIILSVDGEVKLLHYGTTMARVPAEGALTVPEVAGRTPAPPGAADAYLVGALLRSLLPPPAPGTALPPMLVRLIDRAMAPDPAMRHADGDDLRAALSPILRGLRSAGGAASAITPPVGDLVRSLVGPGGTADRAALAALAKSFDPKRGASPPTWKVITLTRLEAGGAVRSAAPRPTSPTLELVVGQVIPGTRYRILSTIGEGGMGTVYAAEHVDLEKKVALKVLRADVAPDPETLQQFRQEARAASKIGSAYICDVTDFGELTDGRVFFVMEHLDGPSLGRVLRQASHLDPARALPIMRQVAKALGAAHGKGIVHLDVKPDNVMLLEQGRRGDAVKVVDFGIAGLLHQGGEEEEIAGTPEYIAPERASGHGYDSRSDVYALGVMAYEMLSGNVPFHGKNHIATLTMQVKDPPLPLKRQPSAKDVPDELAAVVMRMLEKDPGARPQSMAEAEGLMCEAQIAAGLTTAWDDLELPAVDEVWRVKLQRRMPSAARPRRALVIGASSVAAVSLAVAAYFGLIRKPAVVVREVRVELTKTEEAPVVAAALLRADQAARRERYVRPPTDSALSHIQVAEEEARKLGRRSAGAASLRRAYASALTVIGNELMKADLRELAVPKYKEALFFLPDDADLQAKAEITPEERKRLRHDERRPGAATGSASSSSSTSAAAAPAPAAAPPAADEAKDAATRVFLAATRGRLSEARLAIKTLAAVDRGGAQQARLADALRARADGSWGAGKKDEARPLYALVADLDPSDGDARERAKAPPAPPAAAPGGVAGAPGSSGAAGAPGTAGGAPGGAGPVAAGPTPGGTGGGPTTPKTRRHDEPVREEDSGGRRDPVASQKAAEAGAAAMGRGKLTDAEQAFTRAVRADATNAVAVGGLAEVAFERARYTEALDYARRAARLAPRAPKYLVQTGDAYFKLLRYDEAMTSYEKARGLAPHDDSIRSRVDRVKAKLGK